MRTFIVAMIISVGFLAATVLAIRNRRLRDQAALMWLGVAMLLVVCSILLPLGVLDHVAHAVGIVYASDLLLSVAVVFLVVLVFHQSVQLAATKDRQTALTQEIALMRTEPPDFATAGHVQLEGDPARTPASEVFDVPERQPRP
jgi:hypothetical protein